MDERKSETTIEPIATDDEHGCECNCGGLLCGVQVIEMTGFASSKEEMTTPVATS